LERNKFRSKKFSLFISIILFLILGIFTLRTQFYQVSSKKKLITQYKRELDAIGQNALKSKDMPISAILIYNFEIIGRGHNTVVRDSEAGGHAILNAISDAIKNVGLETFSYLNHDSMKIVTTYEPCEMCKGALIEYKIKSLEFLKPKSLSYWLEKQYNELGYEFYKKKLEGSELQDSLFRLHPSYMEVMPDY
jgi:tRNA(Arg) A34 adenosine deaminase TadA